MTSYHIDRREITALHEAAHAVAALSLNHARDPLDVCIHPDGRGFTRPSDGRSMATLSEAELRQELTVAFSGWCFEAQFFPGDCDDATFCAGDFAQARELVELNGRASDLIALLEQARCDAFALICAEEAAIRRVAAALLERGNLTLAELRSILSAA